MGLGPVQQRQLKLRHAGQQVGVVVPLAHFGGHVGADVGDAGVIGVFFVGDEQVELAVFLHFDAELIQPLDGRVAGKEVLRAGAEGDDLEVLHAEHRAGDGHELGHFVGQFPGGADGVLGDIALEVAHAEVVRAVEHAAVGVAAAIDEVAVALGRRHKHAGAVKVFGDEGLGRFGAEVAQKYRQRVAAGGLGLGHSGEHVLLVFDGSLHLDDVKALGLARRDDGRAAGLGQRDGEAVAADRHDAKLDLRDVLQHGKYLLFCVWLYFCLFFPGGLRRRGA